MSQCEDYVSSGRCLQVRFIATRDLVNRCEEVWFGLVSPEMAANLGLSVYLGLFSFPHMQEKQLGRKKGDGIARGSQVRSSCCEMLAVMGEKWLTELDVNFGFQCSTYEILCSSWTNNPHLLCMCMFEKLSVYLIYLVLILPNFI